MAIIALTSNGHGNSSELGAQCLWTHLPSGFFKISAPDLMGALHSEQVVLNFAFIISLWHTDR